METYGNKEYIRKAPKKITLQRLRNIALYYLKRFETSTSNLRAVLHRRIDDYARYDKDFNRQEAYGWVEDLLQDFVQHKYVDDMRFAEIKIRGYLAAGKSPRYILGKIKEKGIDDILATRLLGEQEY
ncbi:MAG: RecX family transcriptional regulator, partial [Alphaproteobacteria bacterium]|nr:RecX family transcriptional regulator [Alphaproteobacteria bacterium]